MRRALQAKEALTMKAFEGVTSHGSESAAALPTCAIADANTSPRAHRRSTSGVWLTRLRRIACLHSSAQARDRRTTGLGDLAALLNLSPELVRRAERLAAERA